LRGDVTLCILELSFVFLTSAFKANDSLFPFLIREAWASPGEGTNKQYIALKFSEPVFELKASFCLLAFLDMNYDSLANQIALSCSCFVRSVEAANQIPRL
jgi:hypothetical protein